MATSAQSQSRIMAGIYKTKEEQDKIKSGRLTSIEALEHYRLVTKIPKTKFITVFTASWHSSKYVIKNRANDNHRSTMTNLCCGGN